MEGFPGGMMGPMGPGMMMPPNMMGMDLPFPGAGMDRGRMWPNEMGGFQGGGAGQSMHPKPNEGSVFYKTRMCHRFLEGNCSFGDRCNYAHSKEEMRALPAEGQKILDNKFKGDRMGGQVDSPIDGPQKDLMKSIPGGASERNGVRTTAFKSRLCTRFMQKGECSYGPTCHFAHGHDDLQNMDRAGTGPAEGPGFEMPFPGNPLMMPGGPMMPPDYMMAMGGMNGGPMMPPRPRPPPGPPPSGPGSSDQLAIPDEDDFIFDVTRTPTRMPSDVPYLDRVRAMCALMGVGPVKPKDVGREAMEAAMSALQTGEAFQANPYADALNA